MRPGLVAIGLLGAALVGAFAAPLLEPPSPSATSLDPEPHARLTARVADLERAVARLRAEQAEPPVVPVAVPSSEPESSTPGVGRTLFDLPTTAAEVRDDRIESEVRKVVAERELAARRARAKQAADKQAAKDEQFLAKLQAALDLTEYQREELLGHLKTRRAVYARFKRAVVGKSEADQAPLQQALKDYVANQDAEMTKLLGVDKFERLMELTSPRKRKK